MNRRKKSTTRFRRLTRSLEARGGDRMPTWNLYAAWVGILLGFFTGSVQGLFFHDENWLGGYGSWPRRMTRLGHFSMFGLAFINLAFVFTLDHVRIDKPLLWPSVLFIAGAFGMPLICYLSAWKKWFRHLFFVPVLSLIVASMLLLGSLLEG